MTDRFLVEEVLEPITTYLDGANLDTVIGFLKQMHEKYGGDAMLSIGIDVDIYEGYDRALVQVVREREENDQEYVKRLRDQGLEREGELAQLAWLKAKYEKS